MAGSARAVGRPKPLAMDEAAAYWRGKKAVTRAEWDQLDEGARSRAFVVTGNLRRDGIGQICTAISQAINDGTTLADFKDRVAPQAIEAGFGQRRLETIFRQNTQTAYMAGRYAQMMAVAEDRPYWRYVAVMDRRTRPAHRALNGLVRRYDDPFWDQFYPPLGFMCRCTVQTLSASQVKARGEEVGKGVPDQLMVTDPETGMETPVVPMPDLGFGANVGRDWLSGLTPSELTGMDIPVPLPTLCQRPGRDHADDPCWLPIAQVEPRHVRPFSASDLLPAATAKGSLTQVGYIKAFLEEFGIGIGQSKAVSLSGVALPLVVSDQLFTNRQTGQWKVTKEGRERYLKLLARTILEPWEIWQSLVTVKGRTTGVLNLIRLFSDGQSRVGGFAVFRLIGNAWQGATVFPPNPDSEAAMLKYLDAQRRDIFKGGGVLLYREK